MERAGRVIARWKASRGAVSAEAFAGAAWRAAVGKRIAAHTLGVKLVRTHLIVEVGDKIWSRQLFSLRGQILRNLEKVVGKGVVEDLEFRVKAPRIGPGREQFPPALPVQRSSGADEAERIPDPVLRLLYKKARQKASA